nr:hypothetical protein [Treponema sp.]
MNYDPGSPLGARQSGEFIIVFIIGAIILAILAGIYVIVHSMQKKHLTKEWIEAQKKKPTSIKDIRTITKDASLTKDERELLIDICRTHNNVNIIYAVQNADDFDSLFKEIYNELSKSGKRAKHIAVLFTLKEKMERFYRKDFVVTSTKNIAVGQVIQFADKAGVHCSATVSENRIDSISIALPLNIANGKNKPDALSRVAFTFTAKNGITYLLNTRVIRYQLAADGSTEMLISHTNDIKQLQRRQSQRIIIGNPCSFSAVKVTSKANSQKSELVY